MAIAFGAIGTKVLGQATTIAVDYPVSVGAGDLLIAGRCIWIENTNTATDESGWTPAGDLWGGVGTGTDSHTARIRGDYTVAAGGETGSVTFDQTVTGVSTQDGIAAIMARYTCSGTWDVAAETGDDAAHTANRAVTLSASHTVAVGDWVVGIVSQDTDASLTITAETFTGTATFGTVTRRTSGAGTALGRDGNIDLFDAEVTGAGTCTGLTFTTASSQCGPASILRLREVAGGSDGNVVAVPATATASALTSVLTAAAAIVATLASMTAAAPVPAVTADSTVTAVVATATASAPIPVVEASTSLAGGGPAAATAQAHPPVVSGDSGGADGTVAGVVAGATATAVAPSVTAASAVVGVAATATGASVAPSVAASSAVVSVVATATAASTAPVVASGVVVAGVVATSSATAFAPVVETFAVAGPAPSERTLIVGAETRVLVVPLENRTMEA